MPKKIEPPWTDGGMNLPRRPNDPHLFDDLWLRGDEQRRIEIGVAGWYPALRTVLNEYRSDAVGFVPRDLGDPPLGPEDDLRGPLVMIFNAAGLVRAAARPRAAGSSAAANGISR